MLTLVKNYRVSNCKCN